jgi:3-hydroxyacyl-[acyl-carrier-protein] dehydratase
MASVSHHESFRIPAGHPALAGHFPGNPVVPGVIVLDQVAAALARTRNQRFAGLPQVKFLAPLLPEQEARLELETSADRLRFRVLRGDDLIASGEATLA